MRAGLLFDGIGGFPLGFSRVGIDNVWSVEVDGPCTRILRRHFPDTAHYRDVARIGPWIEKKHGSVDVIAGGFPCQDISVAGHRAGLDGSRSRLWWEFHRILQEQRPRWCVIENVAGLLSSSGGRDLGAILGSLADLGYGFAYRVLDAQGFGVPQRRRRVFIVGCIGDHRGPAEILLEPESGGGHLATRGDAREVVATLTKNSLGGGGPDDNNAQAGHLIPTRTGTLAASSMSRMDNITAEEGFTIPAAIPVVAGSLTNRIDRGGVNSEGNDGHPIPVVAFHATQTPIHGERHTPALGASARVGVSGEWGVRKLTPRECERLQGFPDDWTDGQSDSHRYKQLGNAVAVPVVEWIARRLIQVHEQGVMV